MAVMEAKQLSTGYRTSVNSKCMEIDTTATTGPYSLLCNWYRSSFLRIKRPGYEKANKFSESTAEVRYE
jgi:hypothetical protein